jgi:Flp pilus assembly protein TadD
LARADQAEARGDLPTALAHAEAAVAAGAGRDAVLTAAKLAIMLEQYDKAIAILQPWVLEDPADAIAHYDLGLAHQHRGDYNLARSGYLAALRADPSHAEARYNLGILCWHKGFTEEAAHHVAKFRQVHPDDPRNAELEAMITPAAAPNAPAPAGESSKATPGTAAAPPRPPASRGR